MCAGSELKDTQGETLSVDGADISDLENGTGRFNDNHGKGFFNSLGIVTEAKKIFKSEDCENDRHKYYWEKIKAPFVYAKGYLHNDEDHPNAKAAAAIIRNIHRNDVPLKMKASVEGGVLARGIKDSTRLARTKIHSVALTFTPANNATLVEPLNVDKSLADWDKDKKLIKSVMHLAETNVPSFRHIERHASANYIYENINKIKELAKTVGIDIEVKDIEPEIIMKNAVFSKIQTNVNKINDLVKALNNKATAPEKGEKQLKFEREAKQLKTNYVIPPKPVDINPTNYMGVKPAAEVKNTNTFKLHASKSMRDPGHMDNVISSLKQKGVDENKINKIVSRIKSHMVEEPVEKSSELEKGDIGRAAKNLVIAGAMGIAADKIGKDVNAKDVKYTKPKKQVERSIASKPKSNRFGNDKYMNQLDDNARARAEKVKAKYSKLKDKLKKALIAGYSGSGNPMSMTGGSVLQPESLDRKAKKSESSDGFSYINCDNCGHEQIYTDHQVKCRKCKKNFPLNKLQDKM